MRPSSVLSILYPPLLVYVNSQNDDDGSLVAGLSSPVTQNVNDWPDANPASWNMSSTMIRRSLVDVSVQSTTHDVGSSC